MTALKSCAVIACVCSIACSIVSIIAPSGRMKKTINLVLGMFLLCSMAVPVIGLFSVSSYEFDADEYIVESQSVDNFEYEKIVLTTTAENLVKAANELLLSNDIKVENIEIGIKKSEDNSIYISSIYIYISKDLEYKTEEIKRIIGSNMSKEPVVIISEEQN